MSIQVHHVGYIVLCSHFLPSSKCIDVVRRNSVLAAFEIEKVYRFYEKAWPVLVPAAKKKFSEIG